jgi:hypothetical protein
MIVEDSPLIWKCYLELHTVAFLCNDASVVYCKSK